MIDQTALWCQDRAMTTKSDFSDEEWSRIVRAPFVAGLAITVADPGGPFEAAKESMAALTSATNPPSREPLLADVVQQHHHPLQGYRPSHGATLGGQVLEELRAVQGLVNAKATPEEAAAFGRWMVDTAQAAATAAKEGGFLGFRAELVSQGEQTMLDQVRGAVGG
jgi:hypothetical protein